MIKTRVKLIGSNKTITDTSMIFQAIKWEIEESDEEFLMYIHGLTADNESVTVLVPDFKPYAYLEIPPEISWDKNKFELMKLFLRRELKDHAPIKMEFVTRKKNYYYREAKFLKLWFNNKKSIYNLENTVRNPVLIAGVGTRRLKYTLHEQKAEPVLQFHAIRKTTPAGWLEAKPATLRSITSEYQPNFSDSDIDMVCSYTDISPIDSDQVTNPIVFSYDIECISSDSTGNTFPNADRKTDQIICIGVTVGRVQDPPDDWVTYALISENDGLNKCSKVQDGSKTRKFKNEKMLLLGFRDLVNEIKPNIITGYNSLAFDDDFLAKRANKLMCWLSFCRMGNIHGRKTKTKSIKWSSSAYGDQEFNSLDIPGIVHLDMKPIISKTYTNLTSYKLDAVSEQFLGDHKIDMPPDELIRGWHSRDPDFFMKIVEYCNKDTDLPLRLMQKLNTWLDLVGMANVMMVQMFDYITRGQQIRIFSQLYCLAYDMDVVCTTKWTNYHPTDEDKIFVGATVQNPKVGLWQRVATFDFKSLYPTTIIAYNICFSTFVPEDENPPPEDYHDLKWEDHSGCEHDTAVRKSKVNKIVCKKHHYRFYKAHVKKGMLPILLERLLDARAKAKERLSAAKKYLEKNGDNMTAEERQQARLNIVRLDKEQNGCKVGANSGYGGLGSDYSLMPFFQGAASTTAMGRRSIQDAIDFALRYRDDTIVVYGDTDSCMICFQNIKTIEECFEICEELEKQINAIFPPPMYLELEKIYSEYFLLSKKRYVGYMADKHGKVYEVDKKGVVIKRRDNCGYLKEVYSYVIDRVMDRSPKWKIYDYLRIKINDLIHGNVGLDMLTINKSIRENYKTTNLPHVAVASKMRSRGQYVSAGTRVKYIFIDTGDPKAPQYVRAEDPEYYLKNKDTIQIDYLYYFEKQLVKPIDDVMEVRFNISNLLKNLLKLLKKGEINDANDYFMPKFKIES